MTTAYKKALTWVLIATAIFSLFRWLFGMGIPGAALEFSLGITVILMGGLISGRYLARIWFAVDQRMTNRLIGWFTVSGIALCFLIGLFVKKMIDKTEFNFFFFTVVALFLLSMCTATIVSLVRNRIRTRILHAQQSLAQTKSELQVLQSQLSPHFLFNTLNNLYGISISDHQKVPGLLLKLSDLLRYSVYEAKEPFVPLKAETEYLKNYIDFEQLRLGTRLELTVRMDTIPDQSVTIAPMLLIVFLENAFKHSRNSGEEKIYIDVALKVSGDKIDFTVKNSYAVNEQPVVRNKNSGFGLESVRKRLQLLYRNRHQLQIEQTGQQYIVNLSLYTA